MPALPHLRRAGISKCEGPRLRGTPKAHDNVTGTVEPGVARPHSPVHLGSSKDPVGFVYEAELAVSHADVEAGGLLEAPEYPMDLIGGEPGVAELIPFDVLLSCIPCGDGLV